MLQDQHELFLYWQEQREIIRLHKENNDPKPWTHDWILKEYRFCNVRREDDRVTRWIRDNIRAPYADYPTLPIMLAIGRWVNDTETLAALIHSEAWPKADFWSPVAFNMELKRRKGFGKKVYNPAYVISPCGSRDKEKFVTDTIARFYVDLHKFQPVTLENAFTFINQFHGWGAFMTYQVVVDMRHTPILNEAPDAYSFAAFGPGTRRGLNRLMGRKLEVKLVDKLLRPEVEVLQALNEIELEASDICNCLCEFDKYMRTRQGIGTPKQRYRG